MMAGPPLSRILNKCPIETVLSISAKDLPRKCGHTPPSQKGRYASTTNHITAQQILFVLCSSVIVMRTRYYKIIHGFTAKDPICFELHSHHLPDGHLRASPRPPTYCVCVLRRLPRVSLPPDMAWPYGFASVGTQQQHATVRYRAGRRVSASGRPAAAA